jgi:ABC-type transport system involved in Fe-S cluster assembly fused permease/ATPase subunit
MPTLGALPEVLRLLRSEADRTVAWNLAAAMLLVVTGGLLAALAPLALKGMVDAVAGAQHDVRQAPSSSALVLGAAYLLAICGGRLLTELRPLLTGAAEQRLDARLTQRFFRHMLGLPLAYHLGRQTGALAHSLVLATTGCQLVIAHLVNSVVPVLVELVTVTVVLAHLNQPALVATFAVTAIVYLLVFAAGSFRLTERSHAVSSASLNAHATLTDSLLNCEAIKCFVAEPAARQRLASTTEELETRWLQLHRLRVCIGLAVAATFTVSVATSLLLAADAVTQGTLTIGGFVLANVYMLQVVRPLEVLGFAARDVSQALGFIRPLLEVLREPTEVSSQEAMSPPAPPPSTESVRTPSVRSATALRQGSPGVQFQGVQFGYDDARPVLKGLDLDIAAGRSLAIVGASGSGKSSLVRLLLRLYEPQAGHILLDQRPIKGLPAGELRAMIGLVPQDTILFNDTLANNIGLGKPGAPRSEIEQAARRAQLHDFVASLPAGYGTLVGERGLKLSGGERQRVAIARALLKRPRIFVFDEATSMLDSQTEAAILRDLQTVSDGCTTITIAHRLSTVLHADDIVVLDKGQVRERGRHAALIAQGGLYARLWHRQMHGGLD